MTEAKAKKIVSIVLEKLLSSKIDDLATGKIIINLQSGGVSGTIKVEQVI